jgi:hypothetical protein
MKKDLFSDREIAEKTQEFFLEVAGFAIKMVLEPSEQIFFKYKLVEAIQQVWGKGSFLGKTSKTWDFEIRFVSRANQMSIIQRERGKKHYYLTFQRDFTSRKVIAFYHTSLPTFQILLREIMAFLLLRDGFLLHASSCQDEKGNLKVFLAPSGGGKTTIANLLSKTKAFVKFSDDILLIRKVKGEWFFFSPPFVEKEMLPTKRKAKNIEIFFIKKSKSPSKEKLDENNKILRFILKQVWVRKEKLEKQTLANVMAFVAENEFYQLRTVLDLKKMRKVLHED